MVHFRYFNSFLLFVCFFSTAWAWSFVGHEITCSIAERFLRPRTREAVIEMLPREAEGKLARVASWADRIKYQRGYGFTGRMHFLNTRGDNPPGRCMTSYIPGRRDVLNAIHNYTYRLDPQTNLEFDQQAEALKFLVHFIGDLHQPMHLTSRQHGGNGATAIFEGHKANLHGIWDTRMLLKTIRELNASTPIPEYTADADYITDSTQNPDFYMPYVRHILKLITNEWRQEIRSWVECPGYPGGSTDPESLIGSETGGEQDADQHPIGIPDRQQRAAADDELDGSDDACDLLTGPAVPHSPYVCPEYWVVALNKLNCEIVWPDYKPGMEMSEGYYRKIVENQVIERLLAMAGIRIAAVLNTLFQDV